MNSPTWQVHFAGGQKVAWALDEDLLWLAKALGEDVTQVPLPFASIVHAAWWPAVLALPHKALAAKTVLCFADNPPSFYLTRPGFEKAAQRVDLWIARTREAEAQFQALGLPVQRAPYCVDPLLFKPLSQGTEFRRDLGIPEDAFVIGNFHRDSEGADLKSPKLQKGPDMFLQVAKHVRALNPKTHVLLAGPRRHWLRAALDAERIPFTFAGSVLPGDDYPKNILSRSRLNELYQILNVCVISSRWEGGPYSVLESLMSGTSVVSTPVGLARDLLPVSAIFRGPAEAAQKICAPGLAVDCKTAAAAALKTNILPALRDSLLRIYSRYPRETTSLRRAFKAAVTTFLSAPAHRPMPEPLAEILQNIQLPGEIAAETPLENDFSMTEALTQTARHWRTLQKS